MQSVTPDSLPELTLADICIADNHLSLLSPGATPTIVVHHGNAACHYERVESWRTPQTAEICAAQQRMFALPNRTYVAPSSWVRAEFARRNGLADDYAQVIVNHVPLIPRTLRAHERPVIIGDWRDANKGAGLWQQIAELLPECDFRPCNFRTDAERIAFYRDADLYLCFSQSEGGSYSMCDAEAAGLPIVTTDTGNAFDFFRGVHPAGAAMDRGFVVIPHEDATGDAAYNQSIAWRIEETLNLGRIRSSFFEFYTFDTWSTKWRAVVERARKGAPALVGG